MSAIGLPAPKQPIKELARASVRQGLGQAWSRAIGRKTQGERGDCTWGIDNLALPYSNTRNYEKKWVETDAQEYEDGDE
jgi:hypothetical protein